MHELTIYKTVTIDYSKFLYHPSTTEIQFLETFTSSLVLLCLKFVRVLKCHVSYISFIHNFHMIIIWYLMFYSLCTHVLFWVFFACFCFYCIKWLNLLFWKEWWNILVKPLLVSASSSAWTHLKLLVHFHLCV